MNANTLTVTCRPNSNPFARVVFTWDWSAGEASASFVAMGFDGSEDSVVEMLLSTGAAEGALLDGWCVNVE